MADQEVDGITLRTILEHMRAMETRIMRHMDARFVSVCGEFNKGFQSIDERLERLERKVDLLFVQVGNIDERLDDIEVVQLPQIRQKVGVS